MTLLRNRWRWLALAVIVVLAGGFLGRNGILGKPVAAVALTRGPVQQTVVASGRVESPQRVQIAPEIGGRVARIPVREGQAVQHGDLLVVLDDADERAALAQAEAAVAQARARLRQIGEAALPAAEHALAQARANAVQARRAFERSQELRARNFVGQSQLDDAKRALDVAEAQLRAAEVQVKSQRPEGAETAAARAALAQAEANVQSAKVRLGHTAIRAPADGVLISRSVEPGDIAQVGRTMMVLAPAGETQLVLQVDEKHLAHLALGQKALASADAFPGQRFGAELVYINPGVDAQRGSVEVKLRVREPPAYLKQDMTVSVDIEVARRDDALLAPADAVRDAAGKAPWVLALRHGRAEKVAVKLGLRGDAVAEILEGVAPDELLIPASAVGVAAGDRVRRKG